MQTLAPPASAATPHTRDPYEARRHAGRCVCVPASSPHIDPDAGQHMHHIRCLKCGRDASWRREARRANTRQQQP